MTISGKVTYERPGIDTTTDGLDYGNVLTLPVRGAFLEALDGAGAVVETSRTDELGDYSIVVPAGDDVRIRVQSRTIEPTGSPADWDLSVTDNTSGNAVYAIQGSLADSGATDSVRDLNAALGWGGSSYTGTRASGPFAILDDGYSSIQTIVDVDADAVLPPIEMRWSVENRSADGDVSRGEIGTSSYQTRRLPDGSLDRAVFILGDEDADTDEFDSSIVVHEWGHYFEDQMSRSDSIGGSHSLNSLLDARVALGEGFGNALSAIVLENPTYRDSFGNQQSQGFNFSLESQPSSNPGWFKEFSVQSILYDIADTNADASDSLAEGFAPIYLAMVDPDYIDLEAFTTIFGLAEYIKINSPGIAAGVDALLARENINGTGILGTGETNEGGVPESLPLFLELTVGGPAVNFCSVDDAGSYNRLGNRKYLRFELTTRQDVTLDMTLSAGASGSNPEFRILREEFIFGRGDSDNADSENLTVTLDPGVYMVDAVAGVNSFEGGTAPAGSYCYDFRITP